MKVSKEVEKILADNNQGVKIDLGCGEWKQPGFIGVDSRKVRGVDIVHNLEEFPWPLPDECASLLMASHVVEHIDPAHGTFLNFMNEAWRLLKPNGQFMIAHPYAGSPGFWQDPTHCNGISEVTWTYFDPLAKNADGSLINLYTIYRPKPWKIVSLSFSVVGNVEILLEKRLLDKSYGN